MFRQFRQNTPSDGLRIRRDAEDYSADKQAEQRVRQRETVVRLAAIRFTARLRIRFIPRN
jgi:hypothetical protein